MFSSIASKVFKQEKISNSPALGKTSNLFQPLEKVKIKTQKQKPLDEINKLVNNLKSESLINVLN